MPLTEAQIRIIESLQPAGEIAKIFEAGARIRNEASFPARGYFLGHAMREMLNKLPDYYEGAASAADAQEEPERFNAEQINALSISWSETVGGHIEPSEDAPAPAETTEIAIPFSLALEINAYLLAEARVDKSRRERLTSFLAGFQKTDPAFMADIAKGLMRLEPDKLAHLPMPEKLRDETEAIDKWDQFERILLGMCGPRHQRYAEISQEVVQWNAL